MATTYLRVRTTGMRVPDNMGHSNAFSTEFDATGVKVLSIDGKNAGGSTLSIANILTMRYVLDGVDLSGSLGPPFTYSWDATSLAGVHAIQAEVLTDLNPGFDLWYGVPSMVFGSLVTGAQTLPIFAAYALASPGGSGAVDALWSDVVYHSYAGGGAPSPLSAPRTIPYISYTTVDTAALLLASGPWTVEPVTNTHHVFWESVLTIRFKANGQPYVGNWYQQSAQISPDAIPGVKKDLQRDGTRGIGTVSPYSTFVSWPGRPGYWLGIDLPGRLFEFEETGEVTTLMGQVKDEFEVTSVRGTFQNGIWNGPNDLCFSVIDANYGFIADTEDHCIQIVNLATATAKVLCGTKGVKGFRGEATDPGGGTLFNRPNSICSHGPHSGKEHIYLADRDNYAIRFTNTFLVPDEVPTVTTLTLMPAPPFVVRWDSAFNIIISTWTASNVYRWRWSTNSLELIISKPLGLGPAGGISWLWLDVDRKGLLGPVDDIFYVYSIASSASMARIAGDGSRANMLLGGGPLLQGPLFLVTDASGHYTWPVAIAHGSPVLSDPTVEESKLLTAGFGSVGPMLYRPIIAANGDITTANVDSTNYSAGHSVHRWRRQNSLKYGKRMYNRLGNKIADEIAELNDTNAEAWFQANIKPGGTATEFKQWIYFVRCNSSRFFRDGANVRYNVDAGTGLTLGGPPDAPPPNPPTVDTPILSGSTAVTGTGTQPATVTGHVNTSSVGTTSVQSTLLWSKAVAALSGGSTVNAKQTVGTQTSGFSNFVIVADPIPPGDPPVVLFHDDFMRDNAPFLGAGRTAFAGRWGIADNVVVSNPTRTRLRVNRTAEEFLTPDYRVHCAITPKSGLGLGGVVARVRDRLNFYALYLRVDTNKVILQYGDTVLGSQYTPPGDALIFDTAYSLRLTASGTTITGEFSTNSGAHWNTAESVTDTNLPGPGSAGLVGYASGSVVEYDDFFF